MKAEDYFKFGSRQKEQKSEKQKLMLGEDELSSECDIPQEEKTTLAESQFMMCTTCNRKPLRVKESATGYLFASCEGFPRCKAAMHLPKCIKNFMVSDIECDMCRNEARGSV